MTNYNREDLVEEIVRLSAEQEDSKKLSKKDAKAFSYLYEQATLNITGKLKIEQVTNQKGETKEKSEKLTLVGYGTYSAKNTKPREVFVNPKQPELGKKLLPSSRKVTFKPSKSFGDTEE